MPRTVAHAFPDIKYCIVNFLNGTAKPRTVAIYQPDKVWDCCQACRDRDKRRRNTNKAERWSPWTLTQVSKEFNRHWRPFYCSRTAHDICAPQLKDYLTTFFHGRGRHMVPVERRGSPVNYARVYLTAETLARISMHELHEAGRAFSRCKSKLGSRVGKDGWGERKEGRKERSLWNSVYRRLNTLFLNGSLKVLCPDAGKIEGLFMDRHRNIRLHPTPQYLSLCPDLDPDIRNALYDLWSSVSVGSIQLLVVPPRDGGEGIQQYENEDHCKLTHPFWKKDPHRSHIRSVCYAKPNYQGGLSFVVKPHEYVLPEGYSLKEIGINEQNILKAGGAAVYVELVSAEDDEFNIRCEGPLDFFYDQADEDFTMLDADTDTAMTDAPEASRAADSVDNGDDMEMSDNDEEDDSESGDDCGAALGTPLDHEEQDGTALILLLAEDMETPLAELMKRVYGVTMEKPLETP
ncbi:hypothetical protein LRP88_00088 [Fusarium phalaenopsidis]|nr:hypothetical protein NCS56_01509200 [Fusarium sp. Ph1]